MKIIIENVPPKCTVRVYNIFKNKSQRKFFVVYYYYAFINHIFPFKETESKVNNLSDSKANFKACSKVIDYILFERSKRNFYLIRCFPHLQVIFHLQFAFSFFQFPEK